MFILYSRFSKNKICTIAFLTLYISDLVKIKYKIRRSETSPVHDPALSRTWSEASPVHDQALSST